MNWLEIIFTMHKTNWIEFRSFRHAAVLPIFTRCLLSIRKLLAHLIATFGSPSYVHLGTSV